MPEYFELPQYRRYAAYERTCPTLLAIARKLRIEAPDA